ncbi:MAG TPA: D-hexose-6-phosphate mutarotase [Crenotrichaceae bacterium]|nr:D-hexose-6-phosphate mutarotase [Crenotrichaceae bacterium]
MMLAQLNKQHGIPEQLEIVQKNNDITLIEINSVHAQATISSHGGQVLSFTPVSSKHDLLFVSKLAQFKAGKAIRGGIPVCWPWFGPDPQNIGPAHGLVRTRLWQIRETALLPDGSIRVILAIQDNDETREIWPHCFDLSITITIAQTLTVELATQNTGATPFTLTQALHTYFNVADSQHIQITGLNKTRYIDKTDSGRVKQQTGAVTITEETDRIYTSTESSLALKDEVFSRNISLQSENSKTVIIWNPWITKSAAMSDFDNQEYKNMVCIETANAGDELITVAPGNSYSILSNYIIEQT